MSETPTKDHTRKGHIVPHCPEGTTLQRKPVADRGLGFGRGSMFCPRPRPRSENHSSVLLGLGQNQNGFPRPRPRSKILEFGPNSSASASV